MSSWSLHPCILASPLVLHYFPLSMIFEPAARAPVPCTDVISYVFSDPPYDHDEPVIFRWGIHFPLLKLLPTRLQNTANRYRSTSMSTIPLAPFPTTKPGPLFVNWSLGCAPGACKKATVSPFTLSMMYGFHLTPSPMRVDYSQMTDLLYHAGPGDRWRRRDFYRIESSLHSF